MPGTYSQLLLPIVFSTIHRQRHITADIAGQLYPYLGGIIRAEHGVLLAINGVEDHVHLYLRWKTDGSIADLMRVVKARSSRWIHETFPPPERFFVAGRIRGVYGEQIARGRGENVYRFTTRASSERGH